MLLGIDLQAYIIFMVINIIFIVLSTRIVFFATVKKIDPIKAVTPTKSLQLLMFWRKQESKRKLEAMS